MEQSLSDEQLMERFLSGRASAFQVLAERHGARVHNFILRQVRDAELARDLTQETFLRVVKNAASFRAQATSTT